MPAKPICLGLLSLALLTPSAAPAQEITTLAEGDLGSFSTHTIRVEGHAQVMVYLDASQAPAECQRNAEVRLLYRLESDMRWFDSGQSLTVVRRPQVRRFPVVGRELVLSVEASGIPAGCGRSFRYAVAGTN